MTKDNKGEIETEKKENKEAWQAVSSLTTIFERGKKESQMVGEQLMRLLETLDGISLGQNMLELRARRKKAAARINSLMDANDSNIQVRNSRL